MLLFIIVYRFKRTFNNRTKHWAPVPIKVAKDYGYMPQLMARIVDRFLADDLPMVRPVEMDANDPRRISLDLDAIPLPPVQQLVQEHLARGLDWV